MLPLQNEPNSHLTTLKSQNLIATSSYQQLNNLSQSKNFTPRSQHMALNLINESSNNLVYANKLATSNQVMTYKAKLQVSFSVLNNIYIYIILNVSYLDVLEYFILIHLYVIS
jgi:hypothetical protein